MQQLNALPNSQELTAMRARRASFHYQPMRSSGAQLEKITELVEAGKIKPVIDSVFPLERAVEAFARSEAGHATGKIVVQIRSADNSKAAVANEDHLLAADRPRLKGRAQGRTVVF